MIEKPDMFFVLTSEGRLGLGWQPSKEAGGCEITKWLPDDMLREAYRALLNRGEEQP